jgi:uncharacterized protein (TIGR02246 family)
MKRILINIGSHFSFDKPTVRVFLGLCVIFAFGCLVSAQEKKAAELKPVEQNSSPSLLEEAKTAITKGNQQWIEGFEKGDAGLIAAIFAEEGIWLGGNGKAHKGQALLDRIKGFIKYYGPGVKITVTSTAVWVDGETAYETGKFVYNYQKDGKPVTDEGRYATIWKRQKDGSWKLILDMPVK